MLIKFKFLHSCVHLNISNTLNQGSKSIGLVYPISVQND